tara:strand:- start:43 stop:213 length:171 start_codon:yes stop_codon:yes gene_type:complete
MTKYIVKEYSVITYRAEANSREEVEKMLEERDETVTNPSFCISWDVNKTTIRKVNE